MNKITLTALLLTILFTLPAYESTAAIIKSEVATSVVSSHIPTAPAAVSKKMLRKNMRLKKRVERMKTKLTKRLDKMRNRTGRLINSNYLTLCLILLVAAVIFFAIGGAIFGIFGSVSALGSAVFFVLWLLEYTGS